MLTERQQEIIQTALEIISSKGIQGLTIKNISLSIGISEPAIYRHFDSKIHILTTILDLFKKDIGQLFDKELTNQGTAMEKIEHMFRNHFDTFVKRPTLTSVVFSEEIFRNEPLLRQKIAEVIAHNNEILSSIVSDGQQAGQIRSDIDAENLTIMIMGTLRLFIKKWQFSGFSFNLLQEGEKVMHMIQSLITAE